MVRKYEVAGRYGYSCVDVFDENGSMLKTSICGLTRKVAEIVASELNEAYNAGVAGTSSIERVSKSIRSRQKREMKEKVSGYSR